MADHDPFLIKIGLLSGDIVAFSALFVNLRRKIGDMCGKMRINEQR
ncbi:MAG: hypothetical protein IK133_09140 [Clostridia bacterium]|nr:hypothetical protein [Clostridia bacterium]MBR5383973.1 hypothetical protein [Clostridia bacterium]